MADSAHSPEPAVRRSQRALNRNRAAPRPSGPAITDRLIRRGYCFTGQRLKNGRISKSWNQNVVRNRTSHGLFRPHMLCYRRSTMQCLLHIPRMVNFLNLDHQDCRHDHFAHNKLGCQLPPIDKSCLLCQLIQLSYAYWTQDENEREVAVLQLDNAMDQVQDLGRFSDETEQQDAHDFLDSFISAIRHVEHAEPQGQDVNVSMDQFFNFIANVDQTFPCQHVNNADERNFGMTLHLHELAGDTLEELIDEQFTTPQDGLCQHAQCVAARSGQSAKQVKTLDRTTTITEAPQILVIALGRVYIERGRHVYTAKERKEIEYPEILDLSAHHRRTLKYRLDGVLSHTGIAAAAGHWVAVVRGPSDEMSFLDDDKPVQTFEANSQRGMDHLLYPRSIKKARGGADAAVLFYSKL